MDLIFRIIKPSEKLPPIKTELFIVQSKNRKETTELEAVCHLISDLIIRGFELGILITTTHISANGLKRIEQHFLKNKIFVLDINDDDLNNFFNGMRLEDILFQKYYNLIIKGL